MGFESDYDVLEERFRQQADEHRIAYGLAPHQEILVPMAFFPAMPTRGGAVDAVFIGMYPSQNWIDGSTPAIRLVDANKKVDAGFRNALSTVWDLIFHLAIRECLLRNDETYYVTDISKGAMKPREEKATRDWNSWYPLLQEEMELVLGGNRQGTARVIPVGGDVEKFLNDDRDFGDWLVSQGLGQLTRRVTHWAWAAYRADESRRGSRYPPKSRLVLDYVRRLEELADQLLNEVNAADWWRAHLKSNLAEINDPWTEWWCRTLFKRYCDEFGTI